MNGYFVNSKKTVHTKLKCKCYKKKVYRRIN